MRTEDTPFWSRKELCKYVFLYVNCFTFKTGALLPPVDTKVAQRAAFTTGNVMVTRSGGGLGESLMGATIFWLSWSRGASKNR